MAAIDPQAVALGAYAAIALIREIRGWREDQRKLQAGETLPTLEPLPEDIKEAAAEFAKEHGLPMPGEAE